MEAKMKRKMLDKFLSRIDQIKNTAAPYLKIDQVFTELVLAEAKELENDLISDGFVAINQGARNQNLNELAITYSGSKFINKGGYVIEFKKDNAFKTDFFFKCLTAIFTIITISLTIWTSTLNNKFSNDKKEINLRIDSIKNVNNQLSEKILQFQQSTDKINKK
jgi:hypothetical protein